VGTATGSKPGRACPTSGQPVDTIDRLTHFLAFR
jgi:hypothetical protein